MSESPQTFVKFKTGLSLFVSSVLSNLSETTQTDPDVYKAL